MRLPILSKHMKKILSDKKRQCEYLQTMNHIHQEDVYENLHDHIAISLL